jgi:hypothetical protein
MDIFKSIINQRKNKRESRGRRKKGKLSQLEQANYFGMREGTFCIVYQRLSIN